MVKKLKEELEIERSIKAGEDVEITKAIEIISMIKKNIPFEEISTQTGISISNIQNINNIINNEE